MQDNITHDSDSHIYHAFDLEADTARWTSPVYNVQFKQLETIRGDHPDTDAFRISAWGVSEGLYQMIEDYGEEQIRASVEWLVIQQNAQVVMMLSEAMAHDDFNFSMLDQIFISIDTELFLPRGLRMHVTCITNIVQIGTDASTIDKFVAVLDPGEARQYVQERRGMTVSKDATIVH